MAKKVRPKGEKLDLETRFEGDEVIITERRDGEVREHRMTMNEFVRRVTEGLVIGEQGESYEAN